MAWTSSLVHGSNTSTAVQLTKLGSSSEDRSRAAPAEETHSSKCRRSRTRVMKSDWTDSVVPGTPISSAAGRNALTISSCSCPVNRSGSWPEKRADTTQHRTSGQM
eukprot:6200707-Pleurochrysis_carterae.AAC.3